MIFKGEGETKVATPSSAPFVVAAHEAENIRAFRRKAAAEEGILIDQQIVLKFRVDPKTGRLVVVGGESRGTIKKSPPASTSSIPSQPDESEEPEPPPSPESMLSLAPEPAGSRDSSETQEAVLQQLRAAERKIGEKIQESEEGDGDQGALPQSSHDLERELQAVRRLIRRLEDEQLFKRLVASQGVVLRSIEKANNLARKLLGMIRNPGEGEASPHPLHIPGSLTGGLPLLGILFSGVA